MSVDLGKEDEGRRAVRLEEQDEPELLERVGAGNVRVENEERRVVLLEDLSSKSKGTSWRFRKGGRGGRRSALSHLTHLSSSGRFLSFPTQPALPELNSARYRGSSSSGEGLTSSQRLRLNREGDFDTKLLLRLLEHRDHDLWTVVDREDNILDSSLDESLDTEGRR